MATPSPMLRLPPELLLRISSHLTTPGIGSFRRCCKHVEATLFDSFAKEFFTKRQFMIEHPSLQALVDIANHPTLSQRLVEVIISVHALPLTNVDWHEGPPKAFYEAGYVSREILLHTGQARDMLAEAFSKLPNLRTVGLRDYDGKGRDRDGEEALWRSFGWSFGREEGDLTRSRCIVHPPNPIFPLILYALGLAKAKPSNVEVFLRRSPKLSPASFSVLDGYMGKAVVPVLAVLRTLMLNISSVDPPHFAFPLPATHQQKVAMVPLKRLLQQTSPLEHLRLNFEPDEESVSEFLDWLGRPASVSPQLTKPIVTDVPPVMLPSLRNLDLGMLSAEGSTLVHVITKFNLSSLNFWKISLRHKDPDQVGDNRNQWSLVLEALSDALASSTRLKHFSVGYPTQRMESDPGANRRVYFAANRDPNDKQMTNAEEKATYRAGYGSNIKQWLKDLAARTWKEEVVLLADSGSDETEDEDEDDDGDEDEDDGLDGEVHEDA